MKEIVIISGKGGTGKTSITAAFAMLARGKAVLADCDVDAADLHLILCPEMLSTQDFYSGYLARINPDLCSLCGECQKVCRFEAISLKQGQFVVNDLNCEGCAYCSRVCPALAINMVEQNVGELFHSTAKTGDPMIHARLRSGADNSGKLVAQVKKEARQSAKETGREYILVDGSPGIGCPVISSLSGARLVILVTEPTISGLHDLKRVYELVKRFHIPAACLVNKADLNLEYSLKIRNNLHSKGILHLADLPYDDSFTRAMTLGKSIVEEDTDLARQVITVWEKILIYEKELQ